MHDGDDEPVVQPDGTIEQAKLRYQSSDARCGDCGCSGDELEWSWYCSDSTSWNSLAGRAGWLVRCPSCDADVMLFCVVVS